LGLILDSSVFIAGERRGETVRQIISRVWTAFGNVECALSVISALELPHGIYRAKSDVDRMRRRAFTDDVLLTMVVHPVSLAIAQLAGRIEGEQAAMGIFHCRPGPDHWNYRPPSRFRGGHTQR
jgi:tRNA(fMet)-specific endonuclease VapC